MQSSSRGQILNSCLIKMEIYMRVTDNIQIFDTSAIFIFVCAFIASMFIPFRMYLYAVRCCEENKCKPTV